MSSRSRVLVYGATGHTGRFVVQELLRRRLTPVLAGRDRSRLEAQSADAALDHRVADVGDEHALRAAVTGVDVVINCAGPFIDTAVPLALEAVKAGAHYLDVSAEQVATRAVLRDLDDQAKSAGVAVVPALAFYGGLPDLLVTLALAGETSADRVEVATALSHWWPTMGTRLTGARHEAPRQVIENGRLVPLSQQLDPESWSYPPPFGQQPVVRLPLSEVMTMDKHLAIGELVSYLNSSAVDDVRDPDTPPPSPVDDLGRSAQRFFLEVRVSRGPQTTRVSCEGRDIYAITAPLVVEGACQLLAGETTRTGACAPGEIFDASALLHAVERDVDDFSFTATASR